MFMEHAYTNEEAQQIIERVKNNELYIVKRTHLFSTFINSLLAIAPQEFDSLTGSERDILKEAIMVVGRVF